MTTLANESRVVKAQQRLQAMGLKFHTETPNSNEMLLVIDMESAVNTLIKRIDAAIQYPKKELKHENKWLLVHFWKGDNPEFGLN